MIFLPALRGPGSKTLVVLPGLGRNARSFAPSLFHSARSKGGLNVVIANYAPSTMESMRDMAQGVWAELERSRTAFPVVLLGYSMGGFVAQLMYWLHPERVYGIVFMATTIPLAEDLLLPLTDKTAFTMFRGILAPDRYAKQKQQLAWQRQSPYPSELSDVFHNSALSKALEFAEISAIIVYAFSSVSKTIAQSIRCPVLVMYGDKDAIMDTSFIFRIPSNLNSAASVKVDCFTGASHYLPLDRPLEVSHSLSLWLAQIGFLN